MNCRCVKRSKKARFFISLLFFTVLPMYAQLEPCSLYEIDGFPEFDHTDIYYPVSLWQSEGEPSAPADFDENSRVDILDLVKVGGCVRYLGPGLLGEYYGFENGEPDQDIAFPNFANLPGDPNPVVVQAIPTFDELGDLGNFLDSSMRRQFGAVFSGFLFVPETADYTLTITGRRGATLTIDGVQQLAFDEGAQFDETTLNLSYGLHPVRLEFYTDAGRPLLSLSWKSNGSIIGPNNVLIGPEHLMHKSKQPHADSISDLRLIVSPSSGSRVDAETLDFQAYILSADTETDFFINDTEYVPSEGLLSETISLNEGVNRFTIRVEDSGGRTIEIPYSIYRPQEANSPGLAVNIFPIETYSGGMPPIDGLSPVATATTPTINMVPESDGGTPVNGDYVYRNTMVSLVGTIDIPQSGLYRFRVSQAGAVFINGHKVAARGYDYFQQRNDEGSIELTAGANHIQMITGRTLGGPSITIFQAFEDGPEAPIPDNVLRHGPQSFDAVPEVANRGSSGRTTTGQVAEYLFREGATFQDSSQNDFHFREDPRAFPGSPGGLTYLSPGTLSSKSAGMVLRAECFRHGGLSLEVDFVVDEILDIGKRYVFSLGDLYSGDLVSIYQRFDDVYLVINDGSTNHPLVAEDAIEIGKRIHVTATTDGTTNRLWINGQLAVEESFPVDFSRWDTMVQLNVGQPYRKSRNLGITHYQMIGSFLAAAAYSRALTEAEININRNANLALHGIPDPVVLPDPVTYPIAGTTQAQLDEAFHILNRLSFGPSPTSVNELLTMGATAWINEQLDPQSIDDSELEAYLATGVFDPDRGYRDLVGQMIYRMIHSKRQLLEVMTWFWENHFHTQINSLTSYPEEQLENERFRAHALGNFKDLLLASARNLPMTLYLNNDTNVVGAPNENYAREILELHTMGVNNGYTKADIEEASRCFTGWTVIDGKFTFNPGLHDYGEKNLLGITIPAGNGMEDGLMLIDHLVGRQETADFIAWKLCRVFIADVPPADVVTAAAAAFHSTNGDITATLTAILTHPRFRTDMSYRNNKFKTPLEFITSLFRMVESYPITPTLTAPLERMGMNLFEFADPTGFAEEETAWSDTNSLLERWTLVSDLVFNRGNGMGTALDVHRFFARYSAADAEGLLDLFENITTHGFEHPDARAIMLNRLTNGDPGSFALTEDTLDTFVRQTFALYLRLPELNRQ